MDGGRIVAYGPPGEVIGAYEAACLESPLETSEHGARHYFVRWEIAGQGNVLKDGMSPVELKFTVRLAEPLVRGHFGLQIRNDANQLIGGWGFDGLACETGMHELSVQLPVLPLRPGTYMLHCTLFNDGNVFLGGKLLEEWNAVPYLIVDTQPLSHQIDAWSGVLNLPAEIAVSPAEKDPA
jgi:hypothetical protein